MIQVKEKPKRACDGKNDPLEPITTVSPSG